MVNISGDIENLDIGEAPSVNIEADIENLDIGLPVPPAGKPGLNPGAMAKMMDVI